MWQANAETTLQDKLYKTVVKDLHKKPDSQRDAPYIKIVEPQAVEALASENIPSQLCGDMRQSCLAGLIALLLLIPAGKRPPSEMVVERKNGSVIESFFDTSENPASGYTYSA